MELPKYITKSRQRYILDSKFFELSLKAKYKVVENIEEYDLQQDREGKILEDHILYDLLVKVILEHSPNESKKMLLFKEYTT